MGPLMGLHDDTMITTYARHSALRGVAVTYNAQPPNPGGVITQTAGVAAFVKHQADLSPGTQGPFQQRTYWIPTATIAAPKRTDFVTDAAGLDWTIIDVRLSRSGLTYCQTRIAQEDS